MPAASNQPRDLTVLSHHPPAASASGPLYELEEESSQGGALGSKQNSQGGSLPTGST